MNWLRKGLIALFVVIAATIAFAAHLGYFGGPVFTDIAPTGRPTPARAHIAAVILSGDMGFRIGMGPRIAKRLATDGIPVVGVNSLTYFRHERTPADVKALIDEATRRALAFGHADKVILIGQSFGADMIPLGLTGLPPHLRAKVRMVGLVVPTTTIFFRASPSELFNWAKPDTLALPPARTLTWTPVVCIHGIEETESLCPQLRQPNVHVVALPGGHPLKGDAGAVHAVLIGAIDASAPSIETLRKISPPPTFGPHA